MMHLLATMKMEIPLAHCEKNGGSARSLRERAEWCGPSGDKKGRWAAG